MGLQEGDEGATGCLPTNLKAREQQYEKLLSNMDDQVWKDLSNDWQGYLLENEESTTW